jgi:hypothetical protein
MSRQVTTPSSSDEILTQLAEQFETTPPSAVDPWWSSQPNSDPADIVREIRARSFLPVLASVPQPTALRRFPVGIIAFLASVALVATATIGVFFGVGLLSLVNSTEAMMPGITGDQGSDAGPPFANAFSRWFSSSSDIRAATRGELEISGSAAVAALPPGAPAQLSHSDQTAPPRINDATPPSPNADGYAEVDRNASSGREMQDEAAASEAAATPVEMPAPTASSLEPAPRPAAAVTPTQPPHLVLSPGEIGDLLTRGDAFLRMGDLTSARLFYERAADAGNGEGAMRMGVTFDPSFLGRARLRGAQGNPVEAQAWYRKAHDLSTADIQRHSSTAEKK